MRHGTRAWAGAPSRGGHRQSTFWHALGGCGRHWGGGVPVEVACVGCAWDGRLVAWPLTLVVDPGRRIYRSFNTTCILTQHGQEGTGKASRVRSHVCFVTRAQLLQSFAGCLHIKELITQPVHRGQKTERRAGVPIIEHELGPWSYLCAQRKRSVWGRAGRSWSLLSVAEGGAGLLKRDKRGGGVGVRRGNNSTQFQQESRTKQQADRRRENKAAKTTGC